jgi:APA family basic amino acid/polyamine antiporter
MAGRKSLGELQSDAESHGLKRALGPFGLVFLGIGCTLGAGIYVLPGNAAAHFAGPAVMISFLIAAFACVMTAFCYAELASTLPVAGSAYTYCYAAVGRGFAFAIGWLLLFEFGVAASTLAVGFSGYFSSLLRDFGIVVPTEIARSLVQSPRKGAELQMGASVNLLAAGIVVLMTFLLTRGISKMSKVNSVLVAIKLTVILLFIAVGFGAIEPANWSPLIPPNEGGFTYGWPGVFRGASLLFFAYLGFEVVANAASECKNPQRDLPIGILGSLAVCAVIYILVAAVLTGTVPYKELGVPDPLAVAVDRMGHARLATLIKMGALVGICSVLLINGYGQSRLAYTISRDRLLPEFFSRLSPRFQTPAAGIAALGTITGVSAALLPLSILNDLVSVGTAFAFSVVALCVMWLRTTQPDLKRPFRVPFGGMRIGKVWVGPVPVLAILFSWTMILPAAIDIAHQARDGHFVPVGILTGYMLVGWVVYRRFTRSGGAAEGLAVLRHEAAALEKTAAALADTRPAS